MEAAERALFGAGVRHALGGGDGPARDAALAELGWRDALGDDRRSAVAVLFECQGSTTSSSAGLDWLLAAALGDEGERVAVVLPPLRHTDAPGRLEQDRCVVVGLATAALARAERALVVTRTPEGDATWPVETGQLECRPVGGLDPALGLCEVTAAIDVARAPEATPADWPAALGLGQLALGHELVGVSRVMLDLARAHALERVQFGRPIGSFQAVRHRLAESFVAVEAAAALLDAAWEDPSPVTAAMAKAFAGRSARTVARHCQQVLAGIGFTTEHPFHRSVRRTMVLDQLLGAGRALTHRLGADVVASATLPPSFAL